MAIRVRFVLSLVVCAAGIMLLASVVLAQSVQDVTTGHNDTYRTGWQQNESTLTPTAVSAGPFGLLWQYQVNGVVFAQPLAYHSTQQIGSQNTCTNCDVVFIADEEDDVYAYEADTSSQQLLWSTTLGSDWDCGSNYPPPCGNGIINPDMGITSTPVIDEVNQIIYVVALQDVSNNPQYYMWALNLRDGTTLASVAISASQPGFPLQEGDQCQQASSTSTVTFDNTDEIQRAGLLLLGNTGSGTYGTVYAAFAPSDHEYENGWLLGYQYSPGSGGSLSQVSEFNTTPFGTGGGMWEGGDGIVAADASVAGNLSTYIFAPTGNGTFDVWTPRINYGDTLLRLSPGTLAVSDFFTPSDQANRCKYDVDLDSGGLIALPDENPAFIPSHPRLMVAADKEAKLFVVDRDDLTGYNSSGDQIVQEIQTPTGSNVNGYWGYPAYYRWSDAQGTHRALYYSVSETFSSRPALPINQYTLTTTGPIPSSYYSTPEFYCFYGAVPSVSSNGSSGGILWAIEDTNKFNLQAPYSCPSGTKEPGTDYLDIALHAYDATNIGTELYNGRGHNTSPHTGYPVKFATPTVFNGKVFAGARNETDTGGIVDVWGLCSEGPQQTCLE